MLTPSEIEKAIEKGMTSAHLSDDGGRMTLILRPANTSRVFQLVATIEEVEEL